MQTPRLPPPDPDWVIKRCLRRHSQSMATITGLFLLIGFALGALVVAISAKPGEELAKAGMGAFAVFWLVAGIVHRVVSTGRRDRMAALLGPLRAELAEAKVVELRRGNARAYAVDLVDKEGVSLRLSAPHASAAEDLVAILK